LRKLKNAAAYNKNDAEPATESTGGTMIIKKVVTVLTLVVIGALAAPTIAHEQEKHDEDSLPPLILGVLDFPNSGAAEAQDAFSRGVMLLHSFEFDDAHSAFLEAQEIDPEFAMAIWGEALTFNHPLWAQQDRESALTALSKLGPRGALQVTEREQRYLDAVAILYGEGSKEQRDVAYMEALRGIYEDYPDDLEAASFYGLSILSSVYERDFRTYMKAASILEEVFAKQPKHPGAAHYLIHSYDDQVHAPLGLRAAREYNKIAPSASHAQHMVSHIYTSLGMWDEVVIANENAVRVSEDSMRRAGKSVANRSKHALSWQQYALLQQGRHDEAVETMRVMRDDVAEVQNGNQKYHNTLMRSIYIIEKPTAKQILSTQDTSEFRLDDKAVEAFASGFRYVAMNDLDSARYELEVLQKNIAEARILSVAEGLHEDYSATSADGYNIATIFARELQALLHFKEGDTETALQLLAAAAEDENSRPMEYGPPYVSKPSSELIGEMLLTLGRPGEAIEHFEMALERNTGRTLSLLGLARAQEATEHPKAQETWRTLENNWKADMAELRQTEYVWLSTGETT
jgi:tetratricopeptide (TPR) repeat protein